MKALNDGSCESIPARAMACIAMALASIGLADLAAAADGTAKAAGKSPYTWTDVAKWPDFTTGSWGRGVANLGGLIGRNPGINAAPGQEIDAPGKRIDQGQSAAAGTSSAPPPATRRRKAKDGGPCFGTAPYCNVWELPLTDEYRAGLSKQGFNAVEETCEPMGVVPESGQKFFFAKDAVVIGGLSDYYNAWRRVYMDGRGHPEDIEPTYFGHSIGRWEGDTLVVDTVGITAEARIATGLKIGNYDTHVVERMRLKDPNTLEIKKTVTNPGLFTQPVEWTETIKRVLDYEFPESYCWHDRREGGGMDDKLE